MTQINNPTEPFDLSFFDDTPPDISGPSPRSFSTFQWVNGSQQRKSEGGVSYHGGWFLPEGQAPEGIELPRWVFTTENGTKIPGFAVPALKVAILAFRKCWQVGSREAFQRFPWGKFEAAKAYAQELGERPRGRVHVLVAIQGLEVFGPFSLNIAGMAGRAFLTEVIQPVGKLLRDPASRIIRGQRGPKHPGAPLRSFWVTVGHKANGNGLPVFEKVGKEGNSKLITPPSVWDLPAKAPKSWEEMVPFFVGQENLALFSTWYEQEALEWIKAWDAETPAPAQAQAGEWGEEGDIPL